MWYDEFMKKFGLIKGKDIILFIILLVVCAVVFLYMLFLKKDGNRIIVEQSGEVIMELSLEDDGTYVIEDREFVNELVIKDGVAYMKSANCRDLVCVHHGAISKVNETITCLPHRLIVYVVGEDISEVDAVVN